MKFKNCKILLNKLGGKYTDTKFNIELHKPCLVKQKSKLTTSLIIHIQKQLVNTADCYVIRQIKEENFQSSITHQS